MVNSVMRDVYPRALVGVETTLALEPGRWNTGNLENGYTSTEASMPDSILSGAVNSEGEPKQAGLWRRYKIHVRAERLEGGRNWVGEQAPAPAWRIEELTKNGMQTMANAAGESMTYTFERSSAGQPQRGRRYVVETDSLGDDNAMPGYRIAMETACGHWVKFSYEESVSDVRDGACGVGPKPVVSEPPWRGDADCGGLDGWRWLIKGSSKTGYRWEKKTVHGGWLQVNTKDYRPGPTYAIQGETLS
jgi:hypothetical protein